jgi:hypothetical protein
MGASAGTNGADAGAEGVDGLLTSPGFGAAAVVGSPPPIREEDEADLRREENEAVPAVSPHFPAVDTLPEVDEEGNLVPSGLPAPRRVSKVVALPSSCLLPP